MTTTNFNATTTSIPVALGPVTASAIEKRFSATEAQLEVWLSSQQSIEANCAYNEISSMVIRGSLDAALLEQALTAIVQRNAAFRSTFSADGQEVIVGSNAEYDFTRVDWSNDPSVDLDVAQLEVVQCQACTPFDLVKGPLLRCVLQKISDQHHKLTFSAHHIILDGWSLAVFCRDLGYFYDTLSGVQRDPLPAANTYDQYAIAMDEYLSSEAGKADEAFWVDQFEDQIPVLDLPIEKKRPSLRTYYGRRYDHQFSAELVEKIRQVGAKSGCSLFNVMLAAFNAYVARISGNDDFCIGIPTAGQAALDHPELIGHCVNTMPLRTRVNIQDAFGDYMKQARGTLLDAFDHQCYSYGTLLRKLAPPRDPSRPPMLSVSFNIDPVIDTRSMGFEGLDIDVQVEPRSFENFEWFINGVIQKDKSIELQIQYNADLYSTQSMQFYMQGFDAFLNGIVAQPEAKIAELPLMTLGQREQVLVQWNDTPLEYPLQSTLGDEFARQARQTPEKIAVRFGDVELTYQQVESRSNQIARYLKSQGVVAGDLVGICVQRSEKMLVQLYAILKAGAGYVPLDPAYPSDRLEYMCDHSGLKLILTEENLTQQVAEFGKPMIVVDRAKSEIQQLDDSSVESTASPADICYVIYTSGSTGKPKGVQVPHGAVVNFLYAMQETPGFSADDSVLAVTTLSFDIAVLELYLPTISGGTVVILDSASSADGEQLALEIEQHDISLMQATPATWRLLIGAGWKGKPEMKILCGGEPMPQDLVAPLLDRCAELWNMYGPTETTVWSAAFQITDAEAPILIGRPIGNTQIYILDPQGNEVPAGCQGEVFIGGGGVTLGYRNRQDLTDERFIENRYRNPFADYVSDKLYKTGDLARYCFDGNIEFLRRNDKQVKVRGFRIELGEIENALKQHSNVEQTVVIVREDSPGNARLVAYLITNDGQPADATGLKQHLRQSLPYYMLPQHFVSLDAMPQTNNGKIDYKALPEPSAEPAVAADQLAPNTPAEKFLAEVWAEVLETEDVCLHDNFFDIGGHSLLVMKVITAVKDKTGFKLGPQDFLVGTLEQLADKFSDAKVFGAQPKTKSATIDSTANVDSTADGESSANNSIAAKAESRFANSEPTTEETAESTSSLDSGTSQEPANVDSGLQARAVSSQRGVLKMLKGFWQ